ncbi:hypothetical protein [Bradyrhizobium sp. Tv2a-2]|uniref:hypothetical protein n=1 Tax=Bradyrhizobium sp. Tv2a-2 TaxID=113395 RepID=UPI000466D59E|nr:hypothetical protein [Bradyrhizobium sp. Tv2a-2]
MSDELHELSIGDLDEVSGGIYRNFTPGVFLTPSIPIPPPEPATALAPGDWSWEGNGQSLAK